MKVIIIDDEKAMHLVMKRMLEKIDQVEIVGCFQNTASAFSFFEEHHVDLAFVDIQVPGESGLDFARRLRERYDGKLKLIFVTSHKEYALPAFDVYAYDYIVKPVSQKRLSETLERALSDERADKGEISLPPLIESLTRREKEVLQLLSNGMSNKEIAEKFKLTEGTVKSHIVNIFGKLQVKNRVQAANTGKRFKIIR